MKTPRYLVCCSLLLTPIVGACAPDGQPVRIETIAGIKQPREVKIDATDFQIPTTTTTLPPPPPPSSTTQPSRSPRTGTTRHRTSPPTPRPQPSGGGGSVWYRLAQCESGGNWSINTGNGYYGGLQMDMSFWKSYGGSAFAARPDLASAGSQITVATRARDSGRGYSPWPACSRKLGLR